MITDLSSKSSPGGGEVDLGDHRRSIRWDLGTGIAGGEEHTELFIVVNGLFTNLNNITWT